MINNLLDLNEVAVDCDTCHETLDLQFAEQHVQVRTNQADIALALKAYYKSYLTLSSGATTQHKVQLYVIEQIAVGDDLDWLEVPREEGKLGRKEGYLDVSGGRWIKKFKTGMSFLQRPNNVVALGPCENNLAQIINFINNQFLNHYLRQGFTLGHASAFTFLGQATAIAAASGGGKSTLMLRCLEDSSRDFLTNDRILLKREGKQTRTIGLAKLPRVNPGTLLNSERLRHILPDDRQQALLAMSTAELWSLEEKYDVQIEDDYGPKRVQLEGELQNLIMLDWSLDSNDATFMEPVDLTQQPEAIEGLRKRPGPFYQDAKGQFADLNDIDSIPHYVDALRNVNVFRLGGKVDFDRAYQLIGDMLEKVSG
ncbi:HprK-related kinase B [Marinomonas sp. THO17]|uniref:HprK-related kinase B n=1 Tax=Marinomonas sp. THO17 TaxID=3149048 RepID=UPI00336BB27C